MSFYNDFPWTNYHELNLDWLLRNSKQLNDRVTRLEEDYPQPVPPPEPVEITRPYIWVDEYGAKGDGSTDDSTAIQRAIDSNPKSRYVFTPGKRYVVSAPINIWYECTPCIFDLNNATIANGNSANDTIIKTGQAKNSSTNTGASTVIEINSGRIDLNLIQNTIGVAIVKTGCRVLVTNTKVVGIAAGACGFKSINAYPNQSGQSRKDIFSNVICYGDTRGTSGIINETTSCGWDFRTNEAWDNIFSNCGGYWLANGIKAIGGILVNNFHFWADQTRYTNITNYAKTCAIETYRGQLANLYLDCGTCIREPIGGGTLEISNLHCEAGSSTQTISWFNEMIGIEMNGYVSASNCPQLQVNGYYFADGTGATSFSQFKFIPFKFSGTGNNNYNFECLMSGDKCISTANKKFNVVYRANIYDMAIAPIGSDPVSPFVRGYGTSTQSSLPQTGKYYLIGYLKCTDSTGTNFGVININTWSKSTTNYCSYTGLALASTSNTFTYQSHGGNNSLFMGATIDLQGAANVRPIYIYADGTNDFSTSGLIYVRGSAIGKAVFIPCTWYDCNTCETSNGTGLIEIVNS